MNRTGIILIISLLISCGIFHVAVAQKPDATNKNRSEAFYDSIYQKMNRHRLSRMLYDLTFIPPEDSAIVDTVITEKNDIPFLTWNNMVIGDILIKVLNPFGTSVTDPSVKPESGAAKFGNNMHITTRKSVLKNQLMIKPGDRVNPTKIADNLRIIQELPYIDDARFFLTETAPGSDTVMVLLVAKDNWSIGGTLNVISLSKFRGSLYDGNFLGSGDRLTLNMSIDGGRGPFYQVDGVSYEFTNISGSFINIRMAFEQDDIGNQTLNIDANRPFFSYATKFAGGIGGELGTVVSELGDGSKQNGCYIQESAWFGFSKPLSSQATRAVVAGSVLNRFYYNNPPTGLDYNAGFYDITRFLGSISVSRNLYYNTNYIFKFGQVESFPYGYLYDLTMGPVITSYYTRFYMNLGLSAGDFIKNFGYLYGGIDLGGYLNRNHFEDGLFKLNVSYMTNLFYNPSKRYKFRMFANSRLVYGFNSRTNNVATVNLKDFLNINSVDVDSLYTGNRVLSARMTSICYTPWDFYGFRFALQLAAEAGLVTNRDTDLSRSSLFTGFGLSFLVQNSNLIFPTIHFSCFFYPVSPGIPSVQFDITQVSDLNFSDFSPTAPTVQTIDY